MADNSSSFFVIRGNPSVVGLKAPIGSIVKDLNTRLFYKKIGTANNEWVLETESLALDGVATTTPLSEAGVGRIRYNDGNNRLEYSLNGSSWTAFPTELDTITVTDTQLAFGNSASSLIGSSSLTWDDSDSTFSNSKKLLLTRSTTGSTTLQLENTSNNATSSTVFSLNNNLVGLLNITGYSSAATGTIIDQPKASLADIRLLSGGSALAILTAGADKIAIGTSDTIRAEYTTDGAYVLASGSGAAVTAINRGGFRWNESTHKLQLSEAGSAWSNLGDQPLTNTYVGFGSTGNILTGSASLTFDDVTDVLSVAQAIRAGNGDATTPTISFINNSDTGFYNPGEGYLGIIINGTRRYLFDATNDFTAEAGGFRSKLAGARPTMNDSPSLYIGYDSASDTGEIVSVYDGVAWKPLRYQGVSHKFYNSSIIAATIDSTYFRVGDQSIGSVTMDFNGLIESWYQTETYPRFRITNQLGANGSPAILFAIAGNAPNNGFGYDNQIYFTSYIQTGGSIIAGFRDDGIFLGNGAAGWTGGGVHIRPSETAGTQDGVSALRLSRSSSGTVLANFGLTQEIYLEGASGNQIPAAAFGWAWTQPNETKPCAASRFYVTYSGLNTTNPLGLFGIGEFSNTTREEIAQFMIPIESGVHHERGLYFRTFDTSNLAGSQRAGLTLTASNINGFSPGEFNMRGNIINMIGVTNSGVNSTTDFRIPGTSSTIRLGGTSALISTYGVVPAGQYSTVNTTNGFTANSSANAVFAESTFTGDTGSKAYTVGDVVRALKLLGIMAAS